MSPRSKFRDRRDRRTLACRALGEGPVTPRSGEYCIRAKLRRLLPSSRLGMIKLISNIDCRTAPEIVVFVLFPNLANEIGLPVSISDRRLRLHVVIWKDISDATIAARP